MTVPTIAEGRSLFTQRALFSRRGLALLSLIFWLTVAGAGANAQTEDGAGVALEAGKTIQRELAPEQKHVYKIAMAANQYVRVTVEQKGVDVSLTLFGPDNSQIVEVDSPNGREGPEQLEAAFENAGDYRLEIKAIEKGAPAGRYVAQIADWREAKTEDLKRFRATLAQNEGLKLRAQRTTAALRQAIAKFQESARLTGEIGDKKDQGIATSELALTHQLLGERDLAIQIYQQAIAICHEAGDFKNESTATSNIGFIYNRLADYQTALFYLYRSLEIVSRPDLDSSRTLPLANIAGVYRALGELDRASEYYNEALAAARRYKQGNLEHAVLINLALTYSDLGDHQKGLEAQFQALPYWKAQRDRQGEVLCLGYIGDDYFYLNDYQNALSYFNQQFKLGDETHSYDGIARASFGLGKTYSRLGDPAKALENLHRAKELFEYDAKSSSLILLWIAQTERQTGQLSEAGGHLRKAIELIESVRNRISAQALRTSFFSRENRDVYEAYISLLMDLQSRDPGKNYNQEAFAVSEKARARSFLELLAVSRADIRQGVSTELLERERGLRAQLNDKVGLLSRTILARAAADKVSAAKSDYAKTEEELQQVEAQIRRASPRYAALTQSQTIALPEAQALLDKDSALLEYALGKERSFLWVITSDSVQTFDLPKREDINRAAREFYELLTARNKTVKFETVNERKARVAKAEVEIPRALASLSQMVLAPAAKALTKKRLLIVPDGALFYVPFGVLSKSRSQTVKGRPLVSEHEVVSLPSASTLAVLRKELEGRAAAPKAAAIFADPVFSRDDERYKTLAAKMNDATKASSALAVKSRGVELADFSDLTRAAQEVEGDSAGFNLARLPFTRREADAITFAGASLVNKTALDFLANRAAALDPELAQYRIVHFATHSFISNAHPEVSGIVLSLIDENGKEQNGFLRSSDVYNLKLPADLVVMSGCRTGLGKEIRGEGLVGMTQSFMYAGAARVLVSLWDVQDEATAELMKRFYRGLLGRNKLSAAAALRAAQVSLAEDKRWSSPYYWAGFTLQGEPR